MLWPTHIVHHGHCPDGTVAAWLIGRSITGPCQYYPYAHSQPAPEPVGGTVWVLDVAFDATTLERWAERCDRVIVLDHHLTNAERLAHLNQPLGETLAQISDPSWRGLAVTIDMQRSGAGLAAEAAATIFTDTQTPEFILDIEDRDLWRWARSRSRDVCAAVDHAVTGLDLDATLDALDSIATQPRDDLTALGAALNASFDAAVEELCECAEQVRVGHWDVPLVEVPEKRYGSHVGHMLLDRYPDAPFAGYWYRENGNVHVGLRSSDNRVDVAHVASDFGGGGHRNAAGLSCLDLAHLSRLNVQQPPPTYPGALPIV